MVMALAALASLGGPLLQDQGSAPAVDRSGEAVLRSLLRDLSKARNLHLLVARYDYDDPSDAVSEGAWFELFYREPRVFRHVSTGVMGDGSVYVSDGVSYLRDGLGDQVSLQDAPKDMASAGIDQSYVTTPLFVLLDGEPALDKVVGKSAPVRLLPKEGGTQVVAFRWIDRGEARLSIVDGPTGLRPQKVVFDTEAAQSFFSDVPLKHRCDQVLRWEVVPSFGRDTFSTAPAAGLKVNDSRTKAASGRELPRR